MNDHIIHTVVAETGEKFSQLPAVIFRECPGFPPYLPGFVCVAESTRLRRVRIKFSRCIEIRKFLQNFNSVGFCPVPALDDLVGYAQGYIIPTAALPVIGYCFFTLLVFLHCFTPMSLI